MKKTFTYILFFLAITTPTLAHASKSVTINWAMSDKENVLGYKMYYSYYSDMRNKMLACEPIYDKNATTLTCHDITINKYPVYFTIAAITSTEELSSSIKTIVTPLGKVQNFVALTPGGNALPIAVINYTQETNYFIFDAGNSSDKDGEIQAFHWNFGDGIVAEGSTVNHQFTETATYTVTLSVTDNQGGESQTHRQITITDLIPPQWLKATGQANLSIAYVDSEETSADNNSAGNAIDNNPNTIWHTEWSASSPLPPHEIQLDLGRQYQISKVNYLPRPDNSNGRIARYELYISSNVTDWGSSVAQGTFTNTESLQEISFTETTGRYVRFVALSEVNNNPWSSAAEIDVYAK